MAHSVEGRFPFLDCDVIEFANMLPQRHKILALDEKHLLKVAFKDIIPDSILKRPKQPYRAPDAASFFYSNNLDWVDDLTSEDNIRKANIFNHDAVSRLITKCRRVKGINMSNTDNMRIVAVLSTMLVYHNFIEKDGQGECNEQPPEPIKAIDKAKSHSIK